MTKFFHPEIRIFVTPAENTNEKDANFVQIIWSSTQPLEEWIISGKLECEVVLKASFFSAPMTAFKGSPGMACLYFLPAYLISGQTKNLEEKLPSFCSFWEQIVFQWSYLRADQEAQKTGKLLSQLMNLK